ncbi:DUF3630 family protein [Shewanella aestuarii]|uniref:DUF3630 family protein n=1 Tax=Shewanella aestuarii TaxID=1028752 RepID=A0A6G9QPQ5_9GAMM|nr:DUF3630 family protein [Shewanella aestuarii]QIR15809.1 DUF3630 family protein [Shewanella aestuarii]
MKIYSTSLDKDNLSLLICAKVDFEQFEQFAEPLAQALDCQIRERQWGADRHQWLLDFEGSQLWLHYEFYGDICWLSTERADEFDVLVYLQTLLKPLILDPSQP